MRTSPHRIVRRGTPIRDVPSKQGLYPAYALGFVGGIPKIPANRLLVKHRSALGSSLRYFRWHAPEKLRHSVEALMRWYAEGKLEPCISHRLPLKKSVEAIRLLTDRKAFGKVVVVMEAR